MRVDESKILFTKYAQCPESDLTGTHNASHHPSYMYSLVVQESQRREVNVNVTSSLITDTLSRRDGDDKIVSTQKGNSL